MKREEEKYEKLDQYDFSWNEDEVIFAKEAEYAKTIGSFFISFSALESSLNILVADVINNRSHDLGYHIIKSLSYNGKIQLARDLYFQLINLIPKEKAKERRKKEFDVIFSKLLGLGQFRNKIAHANWVTLDKKSNVRTKINQDNSGAIQFVKIKITPQIISKYTAQCEQLLVRVNHFPGKVFQNFEVPSN